MNRADLLGKTVFYVLPSGERYPGTVIHVYNRLTVDLAVAGHTYSSVPYSGLVPGVTIVNTWHNLDEGVEPTGEEMNEARSNGWEMGEALAALSGKDKGAAVDVSKLMSVGRRFAAMEGYTDLGRGIQYMQGFVSGFQAGGLHDAIEAPKDQEVEE